MIFGYDEDTDEVVIQDADNHQFMLTMTYDEMMEMVGFVDKIRNKHKSEGMTDRELEEFADSFKKFEEWKRGKE